MHQLVPEQHVRQDCIFVKMNGKMREVLFEDMLFIRAVNNYTEIVTTQAKIIVCCPLQNLERALPRNLFFRVHRSCIVPLYRVHEFDHEHIYIEEHAIPLSKKHYAELCRRFIIISTEEVQVIDPVNELSVEEYLVRIKKKKLMSKNS